jgi:hypothetical protein
MRRPFLIGVGESRELEPAGFGGMEIETGATIVWHRCLGAEGQRHGCDAQIVA